MGQVNPDPNFMRELKALSTELDCHFDDKERRFVITHTKAVGRPVCIYQIRTEDNKFRQPSRDDIAFIAAGDTHSDNYQDAETYMSKYQTAHQKETMLNFRERTKDDKLQLVRKFAGITGDASKIQPFRKIEHRATGKVF
jgi:hypothetical protein